MGHIAYAFNDPDNMIDESGKRPNWVNKLKRFASNLFKATTYFYPPAQYVDAALTGVELSKFHDDVERARYNHAMNVVNIGAGNMEKIAHVPGITIAGNEERYIRHCQIVYRDALCEEMLGKPDLVLGKTWDEMEPHNQKEIVGHMTTWDNRVYRYLSKCHAQNAGYTTYKILLWEVKVNETKPFDNFCE